MINEIEFKVANEIEQNTNFIGFIGWGIKDNYNHFVNDKCIAMVKNKGTYISYESYCQAINGYSTQDEAVKDINILQQTFNTIGLDRQLEITKLHNEDYSKESKMIIFKF